ncbi:hypothetical protein NN6n1_33760 [Shinella zoogloeoides]
MHIAKWRFALLVHQRHEHHEGTDGTDREHLRDTETRNQHLGHDVIQREEEVADDHEDSPHREGMPVIGMEEIAKHAGGP